MSPTARVLEVTDALAKSGLQFLIMGGHAVRYYGVDRNTLDFDFHINAEDAEGLTGRLRGTPLFAGDNLIEANLEGERFSSIPDRYITKRKRGMAGILAPWALVSAICAAIPSP